MQKQYSISILKAGLDRQAFSCGISLLDEYLKKQASQDKRKNIAVTYVLNNKLNHEIIGYYTLSSTSIQIANLPITITKKLPHYPLIPATLIGRLAIDLNYQSQGYGEILLIDALQRIYQTSLHVASFAVVVDAINKPAKDFYLKYGFKEIMPHSSKLYLPVKTLKDLFS